MTILELLKKDTTRLVPSWNSNRYSTSEASEIFDTAKSFHFKVEINNENGEIMLISILHETIFLPNINAFRNFFRGYTCHKRLVEYATS